MLGAKNVFAINESFLFNCRGGQEDIDIKLSDIGLRSKTIILKGDQQNFCRLLEGVSKLFLINE